MRPEKQLLLDEIKGQINKYESFLIMRYLGLNANQANEFRGEIARLGGNVEMMRKRILVKAAHAAGITLVLDDLPGHIGLVFGGPDPLETAKTVFRFSESTGKAIEVLGARFEGQLCSATDAERISQLPGKDELRAQLLGLFEAPMSETLGVMDALLSSVLHCIQNKTKE